MNPNAKSILSAAKQLRKALEPIEFEPPVSYVYNPLVYAWRAHEQYVQKFVTAPCRTVFLGMNPGPWGMAQTGIPFGEIDAVCNYLSIQTTIDRPENEHPKRPIQGFSCERSEVSGKRLWGLMSQRFSDQDFFRTHFVANYCPLVFMDDGARNITPDKLSGQVSNRLEAACDQHLLRLLNILKPHFAIGVGAYAYECLKRVTTQNKCHEMIVSKILHPSPASPAANRDWAGQATKQLQEIGVW